MTPENRIDAPTPIALYGAGTLGRMIGRAIDTPFLWIDDTPSKSGSLIDGHEVLGLEAFASREASASLPIFICIYQPGFSFLSKRREIQRSFPQLSVKPFTDLIFSSATEVLPYLFFETPEDFRTKLARYEEVCKLFGDELSKLTLEGHLALRGTGQFDNIVYSPRGDVPFLAKRLTSAVTYYDIGAFDGDTAEEFMAMTDNCYGRIVLVEPDEMNIVRAKNRLRGTSFPDRVEYIRAAVSNVRGEKGFRADGNMGSAIDPEAPRKVRTILLSDLERAGQMYFKLDIEGEEIEALSASFDFIRQRRPLLAISVYHRPDDLLDAIDLLAELPAYDFYLRCHGSSGEDLVLYAIPSR